MRAFAVAWTLLVALAAPAALLAAEEEERPLPAVPPLEQPANPVEQAIEPQPAPAPAPQEAQNAPAPPSQAEPAEPAPVARAAAPGSVTIRDFSFAPRSITVKVGETVTWTNAGPSVHTATGPGFDTGNLEKGESGSHTFGKAGTFAYICTPHPFMKGTVKVVAASAGGGGTGSGGGGGAGGSAGATGSGDSGGGAESDDGGPQLPASGAEAGALGALGVALLALGRLLRRRVRPEGS